MWLNSLATCLDQGLAPLSFSLLLFLYLSLCLNTETYSLKIRYQICYHLRINYYRYWKQKVGPTLSWLTNGWHASICLVRLSMWFDSLATWVAHRLASLSRYRDSVLSMIKFDTWKKDERQSESWDNKNLRLGKWQSFWWRTIKESCWTRNSYHHHHHPNSHHHHHFW